MKKWYQNKKVWILAGGIVVLAGIGGFAATHVKLYQDGSASVSIIGGADGPTSIFVYNSGISVTGMIIIAVILIVSICGICLTRRK